MPSEHPDPAAQGRESGDGHLTPELLEWARRTFDKEAFVAGLREVERTGGVELKDFIHEVEEQALPHE